jgi:hypothetical protein
VPVLQPLMVPVLLLLPRMVAVPLMLLLLLPPLILSVMVPLLLLPPLPVLLRYCCRH